jgi:transcriptional regulator with XRE-family HTH domain
MGLSRKNFMQQFGEKLRFLREKHRITQAQLAEQVGLAQAYISELEWGKNNPSLSLVIKIADIFGLPTIDMLVRDELDLDAGDDPS